RPCVLALSPVRASLFPYTPLFRSLQPRLLVHDRQGDVLIGLKLDDQAVVIDGPALAVAEDGVGHRLELDDDLGALLWKPLAGAQDRKSTRLNSSHVKSSYAVFCLK